MRNKYTNIYSIRKQWLENLGVSLDSAVNTYALSLYLLGLFGGDVTKSYRNLYGVDFELLKLLGGDTSKKYPNIYSLDYEILRILGGDMTKRYPNLYDVDYGFLGEQPTPPPTPVEYKGLTFTALEDAIIEMVNTDNAPDVKYSKDAKEWIQWDYSPISLNSGEKVYFKGNNGTQFNKGYESGYSTFVINGKVDASGKITSLLDDGKDTATELGAYCFRNLFNGCSSLITAPELPDIVLGEYCYYNLFINCENLVNVQENLTSTTGLKKGCYRGMFGNCHSLTKAPILGNTELAQECYYNMFYHCSSLETAPELPALKLVSKCYTGMFVECNKLKYIKALFTTKPSTTYTQNWVIGVAANGMFVKNADATWSVSGTSGIPTGWEIIYSGTNAEIPATYNISTGEAAIDSAAYDAESGTINLSKLQITEEEITEEEITEEYNG